MEGPYGLRALDNLRSEMQTGRLVIQQYLFFWDWFKGKPPVYKPLDTRLKQEKGASSACSGWDGNGAEVLGLGASQLVLLVPGRVPKARLEPTSRGLRAQREGLQATSLVTSGVDQYSLKGPQMTMGNFLHVLELARGFPTKSSYHVDRNILNPVHLRW